MEADVLNFFAQKQGIFCWEYDYRTDKITFRANDKMNISEITKIEAYRQAIARVKQGEDNVSLVYRSLDYDTMKYTWRQMFLYQEGGNSHPTGRAFGFSRIMTEEEERRCDVFQSYEEESSGILRDRKLIFPGRRALVCEARSTNQMITSRLLGNVGISTEVAENGQMARDMFEHSEMNYFDLIFMDIQMPIMDGYESTMEIRDCNHPQAKTIPIIAMTNNAFAEDVQKCIWVGMDAHITKPIRPELVYRTIHKFIPTPEENEKSR